MNDSLTSLILGPFTTASWMDIVDVVLLSFLVYSMLNVLRGTRAFQSVVGIGLLAVVYLLARFGGLTASAWVFDGLSLYAVLGFIILFQEDIRHVLARAGGTVFNPGQHTSDALLMEEVIKAVFALASRRIGALVAIEREASLRTFLEGAHAIDGQVSTELLQCVFHPSSPIHDGAVVIVGGRVKAACVFLPISLSKSLPKIYGTRHRAAIGLTERTDSVCLLVSEERGTVAVVRDGQVIPVSDANDLRQRLQEELGESEEIVAEVVRDRPAP